MRSPSLSTTILSDTFMTSSSLWVMKSTEIPLSVRIFMDSSSLSASDSVSTAVGSSSTSRRMCLLSSSRAISTNCMCPTGSPLTGSISSMPRPIASIDVLASFLIAGMSSHLSGSPKRRPSRLSLVISLLSLMFSVMEKPGRSMNSWWTIPMPSLMASSGDLMSTFSPSRNTSPLKPPVAWMTGIPNRMFIRVDFPAPFSPTRERTSPGPREKDTSLRTRLP
ncbi:MAG: hypothetical protein BWY99_01435 [Synergistetes bacterium ADurb.BinA166]|nr:MAG: hypothetical protein BWY99_01435 [Synergistetes bacterium ADurb.BinA166]